VCDKMSDPQSEHVEAASGDADLATAPDPRPTESRSVLSAVHTPLPVSRINCGGGGEA